jgi:CHAT domain-containing protein/predicted negative regulator of RcsB-dependent stress response
MRRLMIAAISTLILLCLPISTPQGRGLHSIGWLTLRINLLRIGARAVQAPTSERGAAPSAQESISLEPGKPVERELSGDQSHAYKITMVSGQYSRVVVEQRGIDVMVALFTPDGKKIGEVDGEQMAARSETISAIAEVPGAYRIEVRSAKKTAQTGRYQVKIEELREATAEDKDRVAAGALYREAWLSRRGTLEERRKCVEKYQEALVLYRRANDSLGEAEALNSIGQVRYSLGERQKALENYNEALLIRRAIGDRRGEASTLYDIGSVYRALGEMRKALDKYGEALPIALAIGDRQGEAIILNGMGLVYRLLGEMQKALDKHTEALLIARAIDDLEGEATTLNNIGTVYDSLGEIRKALDKYNEALPIERAIGNRTGEANALSNMGRAYDLLGERQKALEKYSEALQIERAIGNRRGEAITINNIGAVYQALGETRKALDKSTEALLILRAIGDRQGEAAILNNIGRVYQALGETQNALEKFNEALPIRQAVGDRSGEVITLNCIGEIYQASGETRKALEIYNEALPISRATGSRSTEGLTLHNLGMAYNSLGEAQKALDKFNDALSIRRAIGVRSEEAQTLQGIAQVEQKRGNLNEAKQSLEQAIGIIESIRANTSSQALRASYLASRQWFYQSYIDVLMRMQEQNPAAAFESLALEISERARARSLLELLTESRADLRQGVDGSLLERERSLQHLLNTKAAAQFALLNRKHTPAQAETFAKEIASLTTEYEELRAQIRARSPRYAALTQPQPLSLAEIQQQVLDPDTLLLEYSLGEDASYLFVVSQTSITWRRLPKRAEIDAVARRVRELLTAPQRQPGDTEAKYQARVKEARANYWPQAAELSRMLLDPVASRLGRQRLLIVADGALQYIPFAALPAPSPGNDEGRNNGADPQPLFVEHEIVSLPSASTLATLRRETAGRKPAGKSLVVLADPVFTDDDTRVRRKVGKAGAKEKTGPADSGETDVAFQQMTRSARETGMISAEGGFGRLLSTRREAAAILALVPERERMQALDFEASRTTALRPEIGEYRIVHFATHGMLNNIHPELSGLVLSLVDEAGRQQDGFLRLQDIYNLKLSADLVVLSACQTGLGKEIKGEGLVGLTRGFMYAGAPRLVASLWKVDDRATSELMKRFYQGLLGPEGLRPAGALRQAQLSIWKQKQWQAPYYWAAFVLQGEWK